jgi:hypothetical protein
VPQPHEAHLKALRIPVIVITQSGMVITES